MCFVWSIGGVDGERFVIIVGLDFGFLFRSGEELYVEVCFWSFVVWGVCDGG